MSFFRLKPPDPKTGLWSREVYEHIRQAYLGKVDNCATVTLKVNVATTTVSDPRIGSASRLFFSATTAAAAAEMDNLWVKSKVTGSAILVHSNTADADKTLEMQVVG